MEMLLANYANMSPKNFYDVADLSNIQTVIRKDLESPLIKECYYENKKYQEVAENFGISISGVKKHIMKALKMLREEFNIRKTVPENEP
jgi:DNA-directed RNA polymerase specialized sigma subunit